LPVAVEMADATVSPPDLAERIGARLREALTVAASVELVPFGSLPRSSYKSKLVDWSGAA
jgi:phenylacetate-CoA ligase